MKNIIEISKRNPNVEFIIIGLRDKFIKDIKLKMIDQKTELKIMFCPFCNTDTLQDEI